MPNVLTDWHSTGLMTFLHMLSEPKTKADVWFTALFFFFLKTHTIIWFVTDKWKDGTLHENGSSMGPKWRATYYVIDQTILLVYLINNQTMYSMKYSQPSKKPHFSRHKLLNGKGSNLIGALYLCTFHSPISNG